MVQSKQSIVGIIQPWNESHKNSWQNLPRLWLTLFYSK